MDNENNLLTNLKEKKFLSKEEQKNTWKLMWTNWKQWHHSVNRSKVAVATKAIYSITNLDQLLLEIGQSRQFYRIDVINDLKGTENMKACFFKYVLRLNKLISYKLSQYTHLNYKIHLN